MGAGQPVSDKPARKRSVVNWRNRRGKREANLNSRMTRLLRWVRKLRPIKHYATRVWLAWLIVYQLERRKPCPWSFARLQYELGMGDQMRHRVRDRLRRLSGLTGGWYKEERDAIVVDIETLESVLPNLAEVARVYRKRYGL